MTYAELKAQLETFTPEQLAAEVVWVGDERGGKIKCLWIAEEDWLEDDGDCVRRSEIARDASEEIAADMTVVIHKGTPQLMVD